MARLRTSRLQQSWAAQVWGAPLWVAPFLGGAALPALRLESAFSCGFSR